MLTELWTQALSARQHLIDDKHTRAWRLFNGFTEGQPTLALDVYARTVVAHNYADPPAMGEATALAALAWARAALPWLQAGLLKHRHSAHAADRRGVWVFGGPTDRVIHENGARYALDLTLNRDASFYLDTRHLREWAQANLNGARVLNTFAYTGSLGVAALAGGARQVIQVDLNRKFLNIAKTSYTLNGFAIRKSDFVTGDFWPLAAHWRRQGELFDCVFLDPPFFAQTAGGVVNLVNNMAALINKARPLVADGGWLVAVNNALFVSGQSYFETLTALCADGYMQVEALIPAPLDCVGAPGLAHLAPPTDPHPFNHTTKIAVLKVRRKDGRASPR